MKEVTLARTTAIADPSIPYRVVLKIKSLGLTDEQFYQMCRDNPEICFEITHQEELIIMAPTGATTGWRNGKLTQRLANWAEEDGTGLIFDSSTLFTLPNGARRSPDAAWMRHDRWDALSAEDQDRFAHVCPDFVVELRSPSDTLPDLQSKMAEYIENGALLGWLIDPINRRVYVYRPGQPVEDLDSPATVSGSPVLPGFVFNVQEIW
jgi:Uma2 family endonuclease